MNCKLIFCLLLLTACSRDPWEVNSTKTFYDVRCLRNRTVYGHGYTNSGRYVSTQHEQCVLNGCDKVVKKVGKYFWNDTTISRERVPMSQCEENI